MTTPVCDFVRSYAAKNPLRLHMPGHKGVSLLGFEDMDITEIDGADSLYEAEGIIAESEANASALFGCDTFYSTEGSSQCIRAMLFLACMSEENAQKPLVMAGRNAHKTFLSAAALLDFDTQWLYGENSSSYLSCDISAEYLEKAIASAVRKPAAVYITSPDYLGNTADIKSLAAVCHSHGVLLLVDNAHGAYFKFLLQSQHPVDLGADMCCDSAHKTLPVLTGGAYLHIAPSVKEKLSPLAKNALAMFGSTSPSYIIMQSLDMANKYIADGYSHKLTQCCERVSGVKKLLKDNGFELSGNEPLKITIAAKAYGYTGKELADILMEKDIVCEFCDPDFIVFMFTPETTPQQLRYFADVICSIPRREAVKTVPPRFSRPKAAMPVRKAAFSPSEEISVKDAVGRVLAAATVGCPPAVPIVVCGEVIDSSAVSCFEYYDTEKCRVVKE